MKQGIVGCTNWKKRHYINLFVQHRTADSADMNIVFKGRADLKTELAENDPANIDNMEGRKEMFYLTMHSTHFIYSYMASDIW